MLQPFMTGPDDFLYMWNVAIAGLTISGLGLLTLVLLKDGRPRQCHRFAVGVLLVLLASPLLLAVAGVLNVGAVTLVARADAHASSQAEFTVEAGDESISTVSGEAPGNLASSAGRAASAWRLVDISRPAAYLWCAGTLFVLIRCMRGLLACRRLKKQATSATESRLLRLNARACDMAQHDYCVPILESGRTSVPLTFGMARPVVVLPEGLAEVLSDDELLCVLTHEAAHIARGDVAVAWLQQLCLWVFWWNPLLHAVHQRLNRAREQICDDYVRRALGAGDTLAAVLVKLAEWSLIRPQRIQPAAALMLHEADDLPQRITRLTEEKHEMRTLQYTKRGLLLVATLVMCTVAVVPVLRAQPKSSEPATSTDEKSAGKKTEPTRLSYNDGSADGRRSIAGAAELISFTLPKEGAKVSAIRIHGSRYGYPQPPKEDFKIHFLNDDLSEVLETREAPYSRFKRGPESWVEIKFAKPVEVPKEFWVGVDFNAERTKGVYVSFDKSTDGSRSRVGAPGGDTREAGTGGDWMIEVVLAE